MMALNAIGQGQPPQNMGGNRNQIIQDPELERRLGAVMDMIAANEANLRAQRAILDRQNQQIGALTNASNAQQDQIERLENQVGEQGNTIDSLENRAGSLESNQTCLKVAVGALSLCVGAGAGVMAGGALVGAELVIATVPTAQAIGGTVGSLVVGVPTISALSFKD